MLNFPCARAKMPLRARAGRAVKQAGGAASFCGRAPSGKGRAPRYRGGNPLSDRAWERDRDATQMRARSPKRPRRIPLRSVPASAPPDNKTGKRNHSRRSMRTAGAVTLQGRFEHDPVAVLPLRSAGAHSVRTRHRKTIVRLFQRRMRVSPLAKDRLRGV